MNSKPFSPSSERNKDCILQLLSSYLLTPQTVLEVASGTGQHALYFAQHLPHVQWQCSELPETMPGLQQWLDETRLSNVLAPQVLDVSRDWPVIPEVCSIFSANSLHIMPWASVLCFFQAAGACLPKDGYLIVYGPVNYAGQYSSPSNADFDVWLKARNPQSGIRDFEALQASATAAGFSLINDHAMPANNRLLVWQKK